MTVITTNVNTTIEEGEDEDSIVSSINIFLSKSQHDYEINSRKTPYIILIIIIILKCGIIGAAIILIILHFTYGETDFKPDWERFSLEMVSDRANFTQAAGYCRKHSKSDAISNLAFFYNQKEENFMQRLLVDMQKNGKLSMKKFDICNYNFYVGMRKSVGEEWVTADGNYIFGSDFLPNVYGQNNETSNEFCTALDVEQNFKVIQLPCQHTVNWNCFVCEHPCKANETQTCFDLWNDKEVTNRTEAIEYCQMADVPGELMGISSSKLLEKLQAELMDDLKGCNSQIAISNLFTLKYESIYEEPMSFISSRFDIKSNTNINKHCLILNLKTFKWIFTDCIEKHCFVCKIIEGIDDQLDYPDDFNH